MIGKKATIGVCIYAEDMNNMVPFYRDIIGFDTRWCKDEPFAEFDTTGGRLTFFMYSRKAFAEGMGESYVSPQGINQTFEVAMWLESYKDVDAEYERLKKLGAYLPTGQPITFPWGIRCFYVADPEGNLIEVGSTNEI